MIEIDNALEKFIRIEGENAYPNEACGILIGSVDNAGLKKATLAQPILNASEEGEQYHRFLIKPEDIMQAEKTARASKLDVIGFYHSHPDHPADPSEYDREHALPFYSYIIVSVMNAEAKEIKSWELNPDRSNFLQEQIGEMT